MTLVTNVRRGHMTAVKDVRLEEFFKILSLPKVSNPFSMGRDRQLPHLVYLVTLTLRVLDHWRALDNGRRLLVTTLRILDHLLSVQ